MANPLYKNYSLNDFDKFDCLKLSIGVYLLLIYLLRGYIVWLMSVTNLNDRVATIAWVYPETSLFYLSLVSGTFGLFFVFVLSLRRPDAHKWVQYCWRRARSLLVIALVFDCAVNIIAFQFWQLLPLNQLIGQIVLSVLFVMFCLLSTRFRINSHEFPTKLPEK
ncbi:DUF2919 family protein [Thalassotalea sp. PLHSN55]|uniref:DUF2919 family protein n=1 Tax=Thalassotalea sp. PLHSN55 TaxID=3435888 RepID=UPI003F839C75